MDCQDVKELIPVYLDGETQPKESQSVRDHLIGCSACQRELEAFKRSWDMLGEFEDIESQPGFVGQFWTRLSFEQSWRERVWQGFLEGFSKRRLASALVTACVVVIIGSVTLHNYFQIRETNQMLANLNEEDFAMVQNIELVENFDLIQEIDFFEDLDIIENLDKHLSYGISVEDAHAPDRVSDSDTLFVPSVISASLNAPVHCNIHRIT